MGKSAQPTYSEDVAGAIRAVGTSNFMPELLNLMRGAASFKGAFVSLLNLGKAPEHVYDNVRAERRSVVVDRWLDRAWLLDPFVVRFIGERHEPVMVLRDVAPDRFANSDYFRIYYKTLFLRDEMGVFVTIANGTLFLSLGPSEGRTRFTRRDVERLTELHPIISALCEQHFHRTPSSGQFEDSEVDFDGVIDKVCKGLTQREIEVVQSLLRGHSTRSIALLLDVSPSTIKVHRKNIYRKLGISSQSALFSMFLHSAND
ncbi:response regulator FixJ [Ruegeria denitrificans]|uniref:Response regulator FixJ n=1 Tax=Ruegeria denitrificans TaxID=1715692 RepID=A0A0P1I8J3_9RHOB|nr:helix-turn-helix transcriptional regulator [Ruegeria denitrificans]CUJ97717.1 response regulator FixJ [Ruegeria denitrificans]